MLSVPALDYMNYRNALKGNYRKGIHTFRSMLENPTQASDFADNLGGVSVVLGVPIDHPDRNSDALLQLLLNSNVLSAANETWLSQFFPGFGDSWDTITAAASRCETIVSTPITWRSVQHDLVGMGKILASLAGLDNTQYADIYALAADADATHIVIAQPRCLELILSSVASIAFLDNEEAVRVILTDETFLATAHDSEQIMQALADSSTARRVLAETYSALQELQDSPYFGVLLDKHTPKMTSNTAPSGKVGGYYAGSSKAEDRYQWFDKNLTNAYDPEGGQAGRITSCYIQYMFPEAVQVFAIGLCGGFGDSAAAAALQTVEISCSNDDSQWDIVVPSMKVAPVSRTELTVRVIDNSIGKVAKYWKIRTLTAANNDTTKQRFSEVDFYYA